MAENFSTLILNVDHCGGCRKKVKKILSKYKSEIKNYTLDEQQSIVTISGPFDPVSFSSKLQKKGGKAIKSIEIKPVEVPTPAPMEPTPAPREPEPAPKAPEPAEEVAPAPEAPKEPAPPEPMPVAEAGVSSGSRYQGQCEDGHCGQGNGYGDGMPPPSSQAVPGGHSNGGRNNQFEAAYEYFSEDNPNSCTIM